MTDRANISVYLSTDMTHRANISVY